jgi:N utilization substance protein B
MIGARRLARILAFQALFEADKTQHAAKSVLDRIMADSCVLEEAISYLQRLSEGRTAEALEKHIKNIRLAEPYARELVENVTKEMNKIDSRIEKYAVEFPVQQLSAVDRNILRLAIWETLFDNKTPPKAAINEAVEIAKAYGTEASSKFVNGVLGSILAAAHR